MPSNDEGGASAPIPSGDKSKRSVSVGSGSGIGGIVLLGGVLAVGIVAGALLKMRRRRKGREIHPGNDHDNELSGKILAISGEDCGYGQSSPKLEIKKVEELKKCKETEAESAESAEEIQPLMEVEPMHLLIESISLKDWKHKNGSTSGKEQDSPRSHFSFSECPSVDQISMESSDSDDFSEVSLHNKYRGQRNQQMDAKAEVYPQEEEITSGKVVDGVCSDSRVGKEVLVSDKEHCTAKESLDPKLEYEESVGSVDGSEEFSRVGGLVEQTDGKEGSLGNTSNESNLDLKGMGPSMGGAGFSEENFQQDRVDTEDPETEISPRVVVHPSNEICYSMIPDGSQESDRLKGDAGLGQEECQQATVDSPLQEKVDSSCDVYCNEEQCSHGVIDSEASQDFLVGISSDCNQQGQDEGAHSGDSDDSKEIVYLINKQCQQEIYVFEETGFTGKDICPRQEQCLWEENVDSNEKQCSEEGICLEESQDSNSVTACNERCQYVAVHSNEFEDSDDVGLVNEPCQHQPCETRESEILKEDVYMERAQCQKKNIDLMDGGSLEEEFLVCKEKCQQLKIDSKESEEAIEDMPVLKEPYEEETTESKERECVEGNAPICKENCQEEVVDLKEPQNLIEDILVYKNDLSDEKNIESKELVDAEDMPLLEEQCQGKRADSREPDDSVDDIPVNNEKRQELISESDKIEDAEEVSHKVECQEAIEAEDTNISEKVHACMEELCQKDTVDSKQSESLKGDFSPCNEQSELEIVDSVKLIDLKDPYEEEQCQKEDIGFQESDYSNGDAIFLNEHCSNGNVGSEACQANSQTCNQPEEVDSEESEYPSRDTLCKQHQPETVNPEKSPEDHKQIPQIYDEGKGVDANEAEYPIENSPLMNEPKEVEQHVTTTSMPQSCKDDGVSEGFQMKDESTDRETDTTLVAAVQGSVVPNLTRKRSKSGWQKMDSSLKSEEEHESSAMHLDRPMPIKIKFIASLFAGLLLFLLICEVTRISISMPAS